MKAHAGDHIIVAAPTTGGSIRDGEVLEVHGADDGPPYLVRWSQSGETGLFFPGSDAHVAASTESTSTESTSTESTATGERAAHTRSWRVNLDLYETEDETKAHAVLVAEASQRLDASGAAYRNPADRPVPEIGDEIAVARALRRLSDRLFELASADISGINGMPVDIDR
jgi:hypothetical protein